MMNHIPKCTFCHSTALKTTLDFGLQPPVNRFIENEESLNHFPLSFGFCLDCGMMQLTQRMPIDEIRPRYPWLTYHEPERHLDDTVAEITKLPNINKESHILGVTYKDQSTIRRLQQLDYHNSVCINESDFECTLPYFGLETIQKLLQDPAVISQLNKKYGQSDLVIMRHVIEHSEDATALMLHLKNLLNKNGYLLLEIPDSEKIIDSHHHPFIWEEHFSYFTEFSFKHFVNKNGTLAWFKRYPYPYEDSLLAAIQFSSNQNKPALGRDPLEVKLNEFTNTFKNIREKWHNTLQNYRAKGYIIAIFGAGHLTAKFINFYQIKDFIDYVIDDNPNKIGKKLPGSERPIISPKHLQNIDVCISTLNPESEIKVRQNLTAFFEKGGLFIPAFPA